MTTNGEPFRLDNKKIVITGTSSGISRSCAVICDQLRARMIMLDISEEGLEETESFLIYPHYVMQQISPISAISPLWWTR